MQAAARGRAVAQSSSVTFRPQSSVLDGDLTHRPRAQVRRTRFPPVPCTTCTNMYMYMYNMYMCRRLRRQPKHEAPPTPSGRTPGSPWDHHLLEPPSTTCTCPCTCACLCFLPPRGSSRNYPATIPQHSCISLTYCAARPQSRTSQTHGASAARLQPTHGMDPRHT